MLHARYEIRGGEDESTDAECKLLRSHGHDVELLEAQNSAIGKTISYPKAVASTIWSRDWYRRVLDALNSKSFDVVHVQNTFPLISPSIYYAAKRLNIPVVQAVRNYRLVCPSANLFRDGVYCDRCVEKTVKWPAVLHACYRDSRAGTGVVAGMNMIHRLAGTWQQEVDIYVAISEFVKARLIQGGLPASKIVVKPNFVDPGNCSLECDAAERDFILYVGRISRDKGAHLLLEAYESAGVKVPLKLVGRGDLQVPSAIRDRVQVVGPLPLADVYRTMREAMCVVMPGAWPEPFGRVAIEAFAQSTPVIAPKAGGLSEIVRDGFNGMLFDAGDVSQLGALLLKASTSPQELAVLGRNARQSYEAEYTPSANYSKIMACYEMAGATFD